MAGRIKEEDIALVRERARIDDVVGSYVTLKNAGGGNLKGLCPFHDEKSPSFNVTPSRGFFYCFGCQEGGDVIDFIQKIDQITFSEAVETLASKVGIQLRYEDSGAPVPRGPGNQRPRLVEAHKVAAEFYVDQLFGAAEAAPGRQFLDKRGFDKDAAVHFGVGFSPRGGDVLTNHLRGRGFTNAELVASGLSADGQRGLYDRFRGRLMWPIRDASSDVIGFGARRLFDDDRIEAKYLNTPETPIYKKSKVLYGVDLARREIAKGRQAVVVEGYTDVMACHLAGVQTAVATCGTAFGDDHARVLRQLLLDHDQFRGEVIFTFDGDEAGQRAALKAFAGDQAFAAQTYVAVEPDGLDPCDLRLEKGDAAVRELIGRRVPLYRFVLGNVLSKYDLDRADTRVDALRDAARLVISIRDRSKVDAFTRELAGHLGMDEDQVRSEVYRAAARQGAAPGQSGRPGSGQPGSGQPGSGQPGRPGSDQTGGAAAVQHGQPVGAPQQPRRADVPSPRDQRYVIEWDALKVAMQHPNLVGVAFDELDDHDFTHPWLAAIRTAMAKAGGPAAAPAAEAWVVAVRDAIGNDPAAAVVGALAVDPLRLGREPDEQYAQALLARLQELTCARRIQDLKSKLQRTNPIDRPDEYNRMFGELIALEAYKAELRNRAISGAI
ncbi:DNA primase [Kribbella jiaozuonensis]|uniref:DNA primase n=1 Tax=Kribbella jiaozuonensis TaxID=2575441 RepID=A0A4U3LTK8_9ACTN|nr:DNA primase [Kribbella jiaozuonensis]TKK79140.1 DNA primase [Kribbella jiaozuonensis]TKK83210.1 DNA primase [Kribbella jiaozuonensis]